MNKLVAALEQIKGYSDDDFDPENPIEYCDLRDRYIEMRSIAKQALSEHRPDYQRVVDELIAALKQALPLAESAAKVESQWNELATKPVDFAKTRYEFMQQTILKAEAVE